MYKGYVIKGYAWKNNGEEELSFAAGNVWYSNGWLCLNRSPLKWNSITPSHPDYHKYVDILRCDNEHKIPVTIFEADEGWRLI